MSCLLQYMKYSHENWFTYIVECSDGSYYTGISKNLPKRLLSHNNGLGAKYTRGKLPVALMWFKELKNKSEASKLEYRIKKLSKNNKIELVKGKIKAESLFSKS